MNMLTHGSHPDLLSTVLGGAREARAFGGKKKRVILDLKKLKNGSENSCIPFNQLLVMLTYNCIQLLKSGS